MKVFAKLPINAFFFYGIFFCLFCIIKTVNAEIPEWASSYPKVIQGASSMNIIVSLNMPGSVYYVVYSTEPKNVTASSVKEHAENGSDNVVARGVLVLKEESERKTAYIKSLKENKTYYACLIAENSDGDLQNDKAVKINKVKLFQRQNQKSFTSKILKENNRGVLVGYNIYFPEEYYKNSQKNFPLFLFLHGRGEKAVSATQISNLEDARLYGPSMLVDQGHELPFIVVSPQTPWEWEVYEKPGAFVNEIVEHLKYNFNVDPSRVYISGVSMGAFGAYSFYQNYPEKVAAAIPLAGWCDINDPCNFKDVPLWVFHNEFDKTIGSGGDKTLVQTLNSCKPAPIPEAKITLFPKSDHDCWTPVFDNVTGPDNVFDWALKHVKGNLPEDGTNMAPSVFGGNNLQISSSNSEVVLKARAQDSDGKIASYLWSQVGGSSVTLKNKQSQNLTITDFSEGKYLFRVTVKDNEGRSSFDEVWVEVQDVILSADIEQEVALISTLSPNPVKDVINVKLSPSWASNSKLMLTDMQGKVLYENPLPGNHESSFISFDVSFLDLQPGIFLLKLTDDYTSETLKFIKE